MASVPRIVQVEANPAGVVPGGISGGFQTRDEQAPQRALQGNAETMRALNRVGESITGAGTTLHERALIDQGLRNETEATEISTRFQSEANKITAEFSQLEGQGATAQAQAFNERLTAARTSALEGVQNPAVRRMLGARIGNSFVTAEGSLYAHNQRAIRVGNVRASEGAAAVAANTAMQFRNDDRQMATQIGIGEAEVRKAAEVMGLDEASTNQRLAAYRGRTYTDIIAATASSSGGIPRAQALFERVRGSLDIDSQQRIQGMLDPLVRANNANGIAEGVLSGGSSAVFNVITGAESRTGAGQETNVRNPESSASGPGQILRGTWNTYAQRLGLEPDTQGRPSPPNRNDRATHERIFNAYMSDAQQQIGRPLNPGEQYAAWVLGIGGAKAFLGSDRNADALALYRTVEPNADRAFSINGRLMRPGMNVGQVLDALAQRVGSAPGSQGGQPDRGQQLQEALRRAGPDPRDQAATLSAFNQRVQVQDSITAQERAGMERRVQDLGQALLQNPSLPIPTADVRRLYQPEQADRILDTLNTQQVGGQIMQGAALATPQQLQDMRADLASGTGPLSQMIRARRGIPVGEDGTVAENDRAADSASRQRIGALLDERITARNQELRNDPAQYVMRDPAVRASADRVVAEPQNREAMAAYMTANREAQTRLGIADSEQRVLGKAMSERIAADLMRADPGAPDSNVAARLNGMREQYGEAWPRVFQDLVRDGRLPPEYQVLAVMPDAAGRADYQRLLQASRAAGGMDKLFSSVTSTQRREASDQVERAVQPFVRSAVATGLSDSIRLADMVHDATKNLAMFYTMQGASPADAARRAADRVINDRYDFQGTMRVPKGQLDAVQAAQGSIMGRFTIEHMGDVPGNQQLTPDERRQIFNDASHRGQWVPNERDNGLVLMMETRNGGRIPVPMREGAPYAQPDGRGGFRMEMHFNNLPQVVIPGITQDMQMQMLEPDEYRGRIMEDEPRRAAAPAPPAAQAAPAPPAAVPDPAARLPGERRGTLRGRWARPEQQ